MDGGRSPMGEDGKLRAMRTRMAGAEGIIISTFTGPSYTKCDDHRRDLVMAHGTGFVHAIERLQTGGLSEFRIQWTGDAGGARPRHH